MKRTQKLNDAVLHWLNTYYNHVAITMSVISQNKEASGIKKKCNIKVKTLFDGDDNTRHTVVSYALLYQKRISMSEAPLCAMCPLIGVLLLLLSLLLHLQTNFFVWQ